MHTFMSSNKVITSSLRDLVKQDLYKVLVLSNQDLKNDYSLTELKSLDKLHELVVKTEETVYSVYKHEYTNYIETMGTFILFLNDQKLKYDFTLFRFMLNIDIENMYLDIDSPDIIISELAYCNGDPITKKTVWETIYKQLSKELEFILSCYNEERTCLNVPSLKYTLPPQLQKLMRTYQEEKIDRILSRLYVDKIDKMSYHTISKAHSEETFDFDYVSDLSDDDADDANPTNVEESKDEQKQVSNIESSIQSILSADTKEEDDAKSVSESVPESVPESIPKVLSSPNIEKAFENTDAVNKHIRESLSSKSRYVQNMLQDILSFVKKDKVKTKGVEFTEKCFMCSAPFIGNYKTYVLNSNSNPEARYFCSPKCMERWNV